MSEGPFATLNLGLSLAADGRPTTPDEAARVEANLSRFLDACGCSLRTAVRVRQVHGARCLDAARCATTAPFDDADALVSIDPAKAILVRTADCVPVLVADPASGGVAAIHAGWRGIVGGVLEAAVHALSSVAGATERSNWIAAIGPSISVEVYEVGAEVADSFSARGLDACVDRSRARAHVDCHRATSMLLERCGLSAKRIDGEPLCTFLGRDEFFSARRDGAVSGRLAAAIAPREISDRPSRPPLRDTRPG